MRYLLIGAAGHAQEVAWSLREQCRATQTPCEISFFDDARPRGPVESGLGSVVGRLEDVKHYLADAEARLVLGVGLPRTKAAVVAKLGLPISPSLTTSMPASACFLTISATADVTRAANAASSSACHASRA